MNVSSTESLISFNRVIHTLPKLYDGLNITLMVECNHFSLALSQKMITSEDDVTLDQSFVLWISSAFGSPTKRLSQVISWKNSLLEFVIISGL